jgi:hypothetical protein
MNENITRYLEDIKVGAKQSHKNMTLYCLLSAREADIEVAPLDEALDNGFLSVTEIDEGGSVPELKVTNKSEQKILMLDGEELVGAKQNRVLNVTVLVAANSETVIPVSCVEHGRWSYKSPEFKSARRTMSPDLKKKKSRSVTDSLRMAGTFASAQGMVWAEIDDKFERMKAMRSPTAALSDLYESYEDNTRDYLKAFQPVENQIGVVVFIDGEIAGLELVGKFSAFKQYHSKIVKSYVMDALETANHKNAAESKPSKKKTKNILESAARANTEMRKSVALGHDIRIESEEVYGAGLEFERQLVQLTIFQKNSEGSPGREKSSMRRASDRRDRTY